MMFQPSLKCSLKPPIMNFKLLSSFFFSGELGLALEVFLFFLLGGFGASLIFVLLFLRLLSLLLLQQLALYFILMFLLLVSNVFAYFDTLNYQVVK